MSYCTFQVWFSSSQPDCYHCHLFHNILWSSHWASFCSLPYMKTTSPTLSSGYIFLCFKFCLSRKDVRYSFHHFFNTAFLHLCIYVCLFCKSLFSISLWSLLGIKYVCDLKTVSLVLKLETENLLLCKLIICCLTLHL